MCPVHSVHGLCRALHAGAAAMSAAHSLSRSQMSTCAEHSVTVMQVLRLVDSIHSAEDFVQLDDGLLRTIESYDRFHRSYLDPEP